MFKPIIHILKPLCELEHLLPFVVVLEKLYHFLGLKCIDETYLRN